MASRNGGGSRSGEAAPWYAEGLRFECQPDCGACCTNHDDYAYVYLDDGEPERLAQALGLDLPTFKRRFMDDDEGWPVLRMDEPECPFLEGSRCGVYEARPKQCRTFPFWGEALKSRAAWRRLGHFCPGIDVGPVHSLPVIRGHLSRRKTDP